MSIDEFVMRLGNTIKEIETERGSNAVKIALDSLAMVKRRVINTGKNEIGQSYGKYSKAVVPFFYYYGKETNRNNKTAVDELRRKHGFFASYHDWRVVNNLQVNFINFSFTNRMWSSLAPVVLINRESRTVVGIEAKSSKDQDKLEFQNARYGEILAVNKDERALIKQANDARILGAFKNNGLL